MNPAVQEASIAAWRDEAHVRENRRKYAEKFDRVTPTMQTAVEVERPDAGFYLWARTPIEEHRIRPSPLRGAAPYRPSGSFLARESNGANPGTNYVRMALVAETGECLEAAPPYRTIHEDTMSTPEKLQSTIEQAWENRERLSPGSAPAKIGKAVAQVLDELDRGRLRVAEKCP